jgi:HTH-type transcriptional regulator/antitoxin HigA
MPSTHHDHDIRLPGRFEDLVRVMAPRAVTDDSHLENSIDLETLVQLVQAYEATHHPVRRPRGIDALRLLLEEHGINASGLAKLLGVHPSMGSKILKGERALTVPHLKVLAAKFKVRADTFID